MLAGGAGEKLGERAFELGQRVKAMLSPLEDVCRYREQRSSDLAMFDVTPRNKRALPFSIAIAPGGVNIDTPVFRMRELPVTEAKVIEQFVVAFLAGRVRRVASLSAGGKTLVTKTYLFDEAGLPLYKAQSRNGVLAQLRRGVRFTREQFLPYRG